MQKVTASLAAAEESSVDSVSIFPVKDFGQRHLLIGGVSYVAPRTSRKQQAVHSCFHTVRLIRAVS